MFSVFFFFFGNRVWLNLYQYERALKVAEHSFQVPMPNSPLLLNHLCFGARFLQESRLITEVFIPAFWQACAVAMATGMVKNEA